MTPRYIGRGGAEQNETMLDMPRSDPPETVDILDSVCIDVSDDLQRF